MRQLKILNQTTKRTKITDLYFNDINKYKLLTREEEEELTYLYKKNKDPKILDKLVKSNLKFVISVAKQYHSKNINLDDLISEGNYGLIKAINNFDPSKGFKLISYAVWWIRQAIMEYLNNKSKTIRLPSNVIISQKKIKDAITLFNNKYMRTPTLYELDDSLEMPITQIKNILLSMNLNIEYIEKNVEGEDFNILNFIIVNDLSENLLLEEDFVVEAKYYINKIKNKTHKLILINHFGLNKERRPMTDAEISDLLDLSKERIRQIRTSLIKYMRKYVKHNL